MRKIRAMRQLRESDASQAVNAFGIGARPTGVSLVTGSDSLIAMRRFTMNITEWFHTIMASTAVAMVIAFAAAY